MWRLISGGDTGTRTLDPMIKSHLLYQLSYVPKTEPEIQNTGFCFRGSGPILTHIFIKCKKNYTNFAIYFLPKSNPALPFPENAVTFPRPYPTNPLSA